MSASAPRVAALRTLRRVTGEGAYADRAFRAEAEGLEGRDLHFAQRLLYGTVQRLRTIDHVLERLSSRPLDAVDPPLRDALRLGIYQLVWLDSVPDRAAVDQTVELAKRGGRSRTGFANAVMRRAAREARAIVAGLGDETPAAASIAHSHPEWVARMWWEVLGPDEARALMRRDNEPAESAVRVNTLRSGWEEVPGLLGGRPAEGLPEAVVLESPLDVHGSREFADGRVIPQSRASMLVSRVLEPQPGERVLDLCAAPGAKTTHIAALMGGEGEIVAVELHESRARELAENCERMGARVEVLCADAREALPGRRFDRVLLDSPCSNLGTLQSRPDARWRKQPEQVEELAALQAELLDAAAGHVEAGGTLVFSTCTISPAENERAVDAFLARHGEFSADDLGAERPDLRHEAAPRYLRTLPHRHGTDGFFVARLRRAAA